jgi:hypothetical protein
MWLHEAGMKISNNPIEVTATAFPAPAIKYGGDFHAVSVYLFAVHVLT